MQWNFQIQVVASEESLHNFLEIIFHTEFSFTINKIFRIHILLDSIFSLIYS